MSIPSNLRYTKEHEWCRVEGDMALVGVTDHAQAALGDIVYLELPKEGASVRKDEPFGVVESVKAVSDLFSPVTGTVVEVNAALLDAPSTLNEDPYDDGWLVKVRMTDPGELEELMDAERYEDFVEDTK
jgi:glycine cleavage system H protein